MDLEESSNTFLASIPETVSIFLSKIHSKRSYLLSAFPPSKVKQNGNETHISLPEVFENETFALPNGVWEIYTTLDDLKSTKDKTWFENTLKSIEKSEKEVKKSLIRKLQANYSLFSQPSKSPYFEPDAVLSLKKSMLEGPLEKYSDDSKKNYISKQIGGPECNQFQIGNTLAKLRIKLSPNGKCFRKLDDYRFFLFCPEWEREQSLTLYGLRLYLEEVAPLASYMIQHSSYENDLTLNSNFESQIFFCYINIFYFTYSKSYAKLTCALKKWKEEFYDQNKKSMFIFYSFMLEIFDCFPAI